MSLDEELLQRLVYAKYLYRSGCEAIDKGLPVSDGIAVSQFQDAVELVLRAIAAKIAASVQPKATFDALVQAIDKESQNSPLPERSFIFGLNNARVTFKHYGQAPRSEEVENYRRGTERFLQSSLRQFFHLDMEEISFASLIRHRRARNYLGWATDYFTQGCYGDCIENSARSFAIIARHVALGGIHFQPFIRLEGDTKKAVDEIHKVLERHETTLSLLTFGIDLRSYNRFRRVAPYYNAVDNGMFTGTTAHLRNTKPTESNASFCLDFATEAGLLIEKQVPYRELGLPRNSGHTEKVIL
jgi:hypothetical protein